MLKRVISLCLFPTKMHHDSFEHFVSHSSDCIFGFDFSEIDEILKENFTSEFHGDTKLGFHFFFYYLKEKIFIACEDFRNI